MSSHDVFVRRYYAELKKKFRADAVALTFGAPHHASLTLAGAMAIRNAWREDDQLLSIVWISDPRELGDEAIDAQFVFGVTEVTREATKGGKPGELPLMNAQRIARWCAEPGRHPIPEVAWYEEFYAQHGLTRSGPPSWGVVGPESTQVAVLFGEPLGKKKAPAGACGLRSGKVTVIGVSVAQLEIGPSGFAPFELPLSAITQEAKALGLKEPRLYILHSPSAVEVPEASRAARPARAAEPTFDEAQLLAELVGSMKDSAIDCFPPGVRILSAERVREHIVLRYEHCGRPDSANAHCPEPLATRSALRAIEDELSQKIGRDTSEE